MVLRLGIGHDEQAIKDANNFNKYYGARKPTQTAQIAFAIAAHYGEKKDWGNVEKRLAGSMKLIDSKAHALTCALRRTPCSAHLRQRTGAVASKGTRPSASSGKTPRRRSLQSKHRRDRAKQVASRALERRRSALLLCGKNNRSIRSRSRVQGTGSRKGPQAHPDQGQGLDWQKAPADRRGVRRVREIVNLQPVPPPVGHRRRFGVGDMWAASSKSSCRSDSGQHEEGLRIRTAYYGLSTRPPSRRSSKPRCVQPCLGSPSVPVLR